MMDLRQILYANEITNRINEPLMQHRNKSGMQHNFDPSSQSRLTKCFNMMMMIHKYFINESKMQQFNNTQIHHKLINEPHINDNNESQMHHWVLEGHI